MNVAIQNTASIDPSLLWRAAADDMQPKRDRADLTALSPEAIDVGAAAPAGKDLPALRTPAQATSTAAGGVANAATASSQQGQWQEAYGLFAVLMSALLENSRSTSEIINAGAKMQLQYADVQADMKRSEGDAQLTGSVISGTMMIGGAVGTAGMGLRAMGMRKSNADSNALASEMQADSLGGKNGVLGRWSKTADGNLLNEVDEPTPPVAAQKPVRSARVDSDLSNKPASAEPFDAPTQTENVTAARRLEKKDSTKDKDGYDYLSSGSNTKPHVSERHSFTDSNAMRLQMHGQALMHASNGVGSIVNGTTQNTVLGYQANERMAESNGQVSSGLGQVGSNARGSADDGMRQAIAAFDQVAAANLGAMEFVAQSSRV